MVATAPNSISVGNAATGLTHIMNVLAGVAPTDAVNVLRLQQGVASIASAARSFAAKGRAAAMEMPMPMLQAGQRATAPAARPIPYALLPDGLAPHIMAFASAPTPRASGVGDPWRADR